MISLPLQGTFSRNLATALLLDLRVEDIIMKTDLTDRAGLAFTFSRSSVTDTRDAAGVTYDVTEHELRVDYVDANTPTILMENAATAGALDLLSASAPWRPQPLTIYGKAILGAAVGASDVLVSVGSSNLNDVTRKGVGIVRGNTGQMVARVVDGAAATDATSANVAAGLHEFRAIFTGALARIAIDGGAAVDSAAIALPTTFHVPTLYVPGDNNVRWIALKIALGVRSLAEMQVLT